MWWSRSETEEEVVIERVDGSRESWWLRGPTEEEEVVIA
jgi:hypothetical protein